MGSSLDKTMPEYIPIPEPGERASRKPDNDESERYAMRTGKNVMNESENRKTQFLHLVIVVASVLAVAFTGGIKMTVPSRHNLMGLHLGAGPAVKGGGGAMAECLCPEGRAGKLASGPEKGTVMVKVPRNAKPGQLLHVYVPDHHDEMVPVRVPRNAKVSRRASTRVAARLSRKARDCYRAG